MNKQNEEAQGNIVEHMSDCEVHNEPAFRKGYCTCRADMLSYKKGFLAGHVKGALDDLSNRACAEEDAISYIVEYALGEEIERDIAFIPGILEEVKHEREL